MLLMQIAMLDHEQKETKKKKKESIIPNKYAIHVRIIYIADIHLCGKKRRHLNKITLHTNYFLKFS